MIVYVDDFKIAGSQDNVTEAWRLIRGPTPQAGERGIILDEPTPAGKLLGCNHECSEIWGPPMNGDQLSVQPLGGETANTPGSTSGTQGTGTSRSQPSASGQILHKQIK
jgi:hypothetical protein